MKNPHLTIDSEIEATFNLKFYSVLGNVVKNILVSGNHIAETIDISDLSNGLYFYNIESQNEKVNGYVIKN